MAKEFPERRESDPKLAKVDFASEKKTSKRHFLRLCQNKIRFGAAQSLDRLQVIHEILFIF